MWKLTSLMARSMFFCTALVSAGCSGTAAQVRPEPIQTRWVLLPIPTKEEKVPLDTVIIGNVGKPIGRDDYTVPLEFSQPMQLRCLVSYRPLDLQGVAYSAPAELNFIVAGPGSDRPCKETPLLLSKELNCLITRKGLARVVVESANPRMALSFGFVCSQVAAASVPADPPPGNPRPPATPTGGAAISEGTPVPSAPPPSTLTKLLDAVGVGGDDHHKILTLLPCDKPLKAGGGKVIIGKSGRLPFSVHDAKNCKIEVANVAEELLLPDTKVRLTQ